MVSFLFRFFVSLLRVVLGLGLGLVVVVVVVVVKVFHLSPEEAQQRDILTRAIWRGGFFFCLSIF